MKLRHLILLIIAFSLVQFFYFFEKERLKAPAESYKENTAALPELKQEIKVKEPQFTFVIAGDVMLDRAIDYNFRGERIYEIFSQFDKSIFKDKDLSIINLEGPISKEEIPADNSGSMVFNFPPSTPDLLSWLGVNAVSLANNHTLNAGREGLENTHDVLGAHSIAYAGSPNKLDQYSVKRFGEGNLKLAVIAINSLEMQESIEGLIRAEKANGNKVLIFPHWGIEYESKASTSQQILAHEWIDAGADLVIGGHPHVIQNAEKYKDKLIFYSLGNFVFDQNFSKETQEGLILVGTFKMDSLEIKVLLQKSIKYKPRLMVGEEKRQIVNAIRKDIGLPPCAEDLDCKISI